ncbi:4Fe-4S dicluster domain-containing protein [Bradyrhizobium oligotrophicum]|uniref:4Fe-4S dicluster domain-containing protein n=1 Tax=Bradyrhizobium oligotrophicum TaxID=44255 RepID=UPI003EB6D767
MPQVNELPTVASPVAEPAPIDRRKALGLLAAGIASGLASCSKPAETIIPYVTMPERLVPGEALHFATTLPLSGYGRGVIVKSIDGRPFKIEGNPRHPASLGATDLFAEATVLSLYDPDRSAVVLRDGAITSYEALQQALVGEQQHMRANDGEGFRLLTGPTTSPTLLRQIGGLLRTYPKARWHAHDPLGDPAAEAGATLAFGRPLHAIPRLDKARIIVALDADPLGAGPDQMRNGRGFAAHRRPTTSDFSRIYAFEPVPSLTGAKADHRLALGMNEIGEVAVAIARAQGAAVREPAIPERARSLVTALTKDLADHRGAALVLAGPGLTAETHALVHWINSHAQAPLGLIEPLTRTPDGHASASISELTADLSAGKVTQIVMIGVNPAYDTPAELGFAAALPNARFRLHAGCYANETAELATWHVPLSHVLESWSDVRASDGTASLIQPLIRPLHRTMTDHELLTQLVGRADARSYDLVRETWRSQGGTDFESWWSQALHDGVIANSAAPPVSAGEPVLPALADAAPKDEQGDDRAALVLRPDPCLWDGSFANNAWLQECPKPLSKQVWGNALLLHPDDARRLRMASGDVVTVTSRGQHVQAPVLIEPGLAPRTASLTLGMGRRKAGAIGSGVGVDAYVLRGGVDSPWLVPSVRFARTGRQQAILTTQNVVRRPDDVRELFPVHQLGKPQPLPKTLAIHDRPSLMPERPRPDNGHAWAMTIDTSLCIGCNACVVACQAENNVPVVGPEEVARGRDMHWLRIDVYDHGGSGDHQLGFQPVPCMHCEHAPCEPVCPVAASVHDGGGLNLQVYNRCVGTRFCEANCPYKVRRFNFFGYADGQEYANLGLDPYREQKNPEVTVRARGVMEKCTYCVQRISAAERAADREGRQVGADEVHTACQNACPTLAITFGDLQQPDASILRRRTEPGHYALLAHLGTRPRTTYLADVRNPAPDHDGGGT